LIIGLSTGISVIVSQYFGAKNNEKVVKSVATGILLISIVSLIMSIAGILFAKSFLNILNTPSDIIVPATIYLTTLFIKILPLGIYHTIASMLRAFGDAISPLIIMIAIAILNILLNLLFVIRLDMGIRGSAMATVISQFIGLIALLIYVSFKNHNFNFNYKNFVFDISIAKIMLKLGLPASIQFTFLSIGNMIVQVIINGFWN
jgi:Na+-driven multidrug efflux pump